MRNEILPDASLSDKQVFSEKITLAREIAEVLRKNVVQARKVENPDSEKEKWRTSQITPLNYSLTRHTLELQITKHTELGDNDSIKSPPPVESSRSARKRTKSVIHTSVPPPSVDIRVLTRCCSS